MNEKQISTIKQHLVVKGDQVTTTSLDVANFFGKKHKDVLKAIQNLECSSEFRGRNFAPTFYEVPGPNNSFRKEPMYELTKDGLIFLAMGYQGERAARIKEAYIMAFNQMAEALQRPAEPGLLVRMVETTTRMYQAINDRLNRIERGTAQRMLEQHLNSQGKKPVRYETTDIRIFVTCQCEEGSDESVRKTELHERYRTWCRERRLDFYGYGSFCQALRQACPDLRDGVVRLPGSGRQSPVFYGLGLKAVEEAGEVVQA